MTLRHFVLIAAALALGGCASSPIATSEATAVPPERLATQGYAKQGPDTGSVLVKRDKAFQSSACTFDLLIDGRRVAEMINGEKVELHLPAGEHILGAKGCWNANVETVIIVNRGQSKAYRVGPSMNGDLLLHQTAL